MDIPSGLDHIEMLAKIAEQNQKLSAAKLDSVKSDLNVIGISLSILYQAGTCHRRCFGEHHILEALSGRAYNLASSAHILICRGFYDEALNLIRGIGEVANLVALSVVDKDSLQQWIGADTKTRLRYFSPAKIRQLVEKHEPSLLCADKDWYSNFCESYTHVHPGTKPNAHNENNNGYVGGVVQNQGLNNSVGELATVVAHLAIMVSEYTKMEDMFSALCEAISDG
ncbi:hypothetical protein KF947_15100 [Halomonas sp. FeN2]|uniref:hypothetical protein n=1 Tax=Halomonas sp. FeN2 TaxID=2832500 RepID=UPI000C3FDA91|nr:MULTISPECIES: hypothetical protein [unclassified Halomonas]MBF56202.1 hypothetical protein [Halomonas sp.]UBR48669.1 hypothetical protein KF947_15100 [Halomonas sp. FeN2]|tara:strand:+ start:501 stop:1178 length:678 start_codon:yes stop_codon:yes gene_type:complete